MTDTLAAGIDLSGPFLGEDQIVRPNPDFDSDVKAEIRLGDKLLRVANEGAIKPNDSQRFILNAILLNFDGSVTAKECYRQGYRVDLPDSRPQSFNYESGRLLDALNIEGANDLVTKESSRRIVTIRIDRFVQIVRVTDEDLESYLGQKVHPMQSTREINIGISANTPGKWAKDGDCRKVDAGLFFPEVGIGVNQAKAVCEDCRVEEECLEFALATEQKHGVWGGKSERERKKIIKERKNAAT